MQPDAYGGELEGGEEVFGELVVAGRDPAKMFDLVEEALDEIARLIEIFAEADRVLAIGFGRDVSPCAAFGHRLAQSVGVVAFVGDQHRVFRQIGDQLGRAGDVAGLAGSQFELDRPPVLVDERMDFGGEPASGTTQTSILTPLLAVAPCWWTRTIEVSII